MQNMKFISDLGNKQQEAYEQISMRIELGDFPPGMLLIERQLCDELGMSRTPVRAALQQLASEGELVIYSPNYGMSVRILTARDVREIFELREVLDGAAVEKFISCASDDAIDAAWVLVRSMRHAAESGDRRALGQYYGHVLQFILDHSENSRMSRIMSRMLPQIRRLRTAFIQSQSMEETIVDLVEWQEQYIEAITARDVKTARMLLRDHLSRMCDKQIEKFFVSKGTTAF